MEKLQIPITDVNKHQLKLQSIVFVETCKMDQFKFCLHKFSYYLDHVKQHVFHFTTEADSYVCFFI